MNVHILTLKHKGISKNLNLRNVYSWLRFVVTMLTVLPLALHQGRSRAESSLLYSQLCNQYEATEVLALVIRFSALPSRFSAHHLSRQKYIRGLGRTIPLFFLPHKSYDLTKACYCITDRRVKVYINLVESYYDVGFLKCEPDSLP